MQRLGIVSVLNQLISNLLCLNFCTAEHNRINLWIEVNQSLQGKVLVACIHHIINMVYTLCTLVTATHYNLFIVMQIPLCNTLYLTTHRSREQQCVTIFRYTSQYLSDTLLKTHVQHLVSLVQNNVSHLVKTSLTTVHKVNQSPRCSHDNLYTMTQLANLCID